MAIAPARMMTSEQTLARIGRLMNVSTNISSVGRVFSDPPICQVQKDPAYDRGLRLRRDRSAVGELLHARHDKALVRFEAVEHRIAVADDWAQLDRPLPRDELPVRLFRNEREVLSADAQH